MVQFMCNVIHGVKVFGTKKILCRQYLISVIYFNKKSLTIKRYILVGCYFCTYFFHLLNFDINEVVSFDINLFIYLFIDDSTRPIGQTRWWPEWHLYIIINPYFFTEISQPQRLWRVCFVFVTFLCLTVCVALLIK